MYPYEHHMVVIKGYVRNRAHPEGSMIEGYTTEEVIECYVDYIKDGKPIGVICHDNMVGSLVKELKEEKYSLTIVMKE